MLERLLKKAGIKELKPKLDGGFTAKCPNPEHTSSKGSFHISMDKGIMKCFSCGFFSPVFDFLLDNGVQAKEALEYKNYDNGYKKRHKEKEFLLGKAIPKSLIDKGIEVGTLKHFGVGYDAYEKHITIPIKENGGIKGVKYRKYPKIFWYSDGFDKNENIYNYKETKERIYCEGETDLWTIWQRGNKKVSHTFGATVSNTQLRMMSLHDRIYLAYDYDIPGIKSMFNIYENLKMLVEIWIIPYKAKKGEKPDPNNTTKQEWKRAVENAEPFILFEKYLIKNRPKIYKLCR